MKKITSVLVLLALLATSAVALGDAAAPAQPAPEVQVIAELTVDANGDGAAETVALTGTQVEDSIAWQGIKLTVRDGATGETAEYALPEDIGYGPRLWVGGLTGADKNDILVSMSSGGSGGLSYYTVFTRTEDGYAIVFDTDSYNSEHAYAVQYQDSYAVRAQSLDHGTVYMLDISAREDSYLAELYLDDGTLKAPVQGDVNPLSFLYPADTDGDGVFEMVAFQRITGLYNADGLGNFVNTLAWDGERFMQRDQCVQITGNQPQARETVG